MPFEIVPIENIILTETPLPDGALAVLGIGLADPLWSMEQDVCFENLALILCALTIS